MQSIALSEAFGRFCALATTQQALRALLSDSASSQKLEEFLHKGTLCVIHRHTILRSGLTSSSKLTTLYVELNNRDTQCQTGSMPVGQRRLGKRESGARPERSGHCERGEQLQSPLCQRHEKAQPIDHPQVRKPAETIRCTASEESRSPDKPGMALFAYVRRLLF